MKKTKIVLILTLLTFSMSSCYDSFGLQARERKMENLITEIEERDVEGIKSLFAPNIVDQLEGFDEQINNLIDYYRGSFEDFLSKTTGTYRSASNYKFITFLYFNNWEVKTSEASYYFLIYWCFEDDFDSNNEGIWNLRLQAYEEGEEPALVEEGWRNSDTYRGITLA